MNDRGVLGNIHLEGWSVSFNFDRTAICNTVGNTFHVGFYSSEFLVL